MAAALLASCSKDTTIDLTPTDTEKIYATIADDDNSRVQLNDQKHTVWNAGDQIVVHSPNDLTIWAFDGKTGDRKGSFSKVGKYNVDMSSLSFDKYYALYSYDNYFSFGTVGAVPAIIMTAPATQQYLKGSYGLHANTMFGTSTDGVNYSFRNMHGYLRLSLTGDKVVSKIELRGNNSETLAGEFYFTIKTPDDHHWYSSQSSTITLDCGSGVALSDTPTEFYFVVPPTTFANGITATITFADGEILPKRTSKQIVIERNTIQPMANISISGGIDWQKIFIYHSGSEVTAPMFYGSSAVAGTINWGDGTTSILGELTSRYYTDGNESHIITIKAIDADTVEIDGCEGIIKIDLSQF